MRKSLIATVSSIVLFASCKEKPPVINFGSGGSSAKDTSYVLSAANIPVSDPHSVLMEEYTGASCTNCPAAHEILKDLQKVNPGRINIIGLYITGPIQTKPPHGAKYDFRHATATTISTDIYGGISSLPSGGVDRVSVSGTLKMDRTQWSNVINDRLKLADSINMRIACSYNPVDSILSIADTTIYTKSVGFPHNLSIVIVEDSIIDVQEYPSTDPVHPGKDEDYDFTNVFRGMVTAAPVGDPLLTSVPIKEAGRVIVRYYKHKLTGVFNPKNCRIIAFINNSSPGDYRILQSTQIPIK